jgi:hypothetical protein
MVNRPRRVSVVVAALSLVVAGCAELDDPPSPRSGPRVSAAEQRDLPTDQFALGSNLCPEEWDDQQLPASEVASRRAEGKRQIAALLDALKTHPDALVTTTYASSDEGPGKEDLSVAELADTHLQGLTEPGLSDTPCEKREARKLRRLIKRLTHGP